MMTSSRHLNHGNRALSRTADHGRSRREVSPVASDLRSHASRGRCRDRVREHIVGAPYLIISTCISWYLPVSPGIPPYPLISRRGYREKNRPDQGYLPSHARPSLIPLIFRRNTSCIWGAVRTRLYERLRFTGHNFLEQASGGGAAAGRGRADPRLGPALGEVGCDIWRFRGLLGP